MVNLLVPSGLTGVRSGAPAMLEEKFVLNWYWPTSTGMELGVEPAVVELVRRFHVIVVGMAVTVRVPAVKEKLYLEELRVPALTWIGKVPGEEVVLATQVKAGTPLTELTRLSEPTKPPKVAVKVGLEAP